MLFIELLIVVVLMTSMVMGGFGLGSMLIGMTIGIGLLIVVHKVLSGLYSTLVDWMLKQHENRRSNRRRILKGEVFKTRNERYLEQLNEAELRARIEENPLDELAVEVLCERLSRDQRWAEYAAEMEYFLTIQKQLSLEEAAGLHHRLADLYLDKLGRPDRAREMLHSIIQRWPKHYQATLARRRLAVLNGEGLPGQDE